jgi:two-component system sensor histidine kinase VicK
MNYTQDGQISVTLKPHHPEERLYLQVVDTGIGIDEEDMPYIFDRFYRGRRVGQLTIPGVGLGLSLAKEIIEQHHGRIYIQSTPAKGTTCTFWLPFAPRA